MDSRKGPHRRCLIITGKMSIYVVLSSDQSLRYYPNNKPNRFRSHLNVPLLLEGTWKVALVEVDVSCNLSIEDAIYICSPICQDSIVEGEKKPLLRRLMMHTPGVWSTIIDSPYYVPVNIKEMSDIEIYLTNKHEEEASFLDRPSTVTLHFKSFPFF